MSFSGFFHVPCLFRVFLQKVAFVPFFFFKPGAVYEVHMFEMKNEWGCGVVRIVRFGRLEGVGVSSWTSNRRQFYQMIVPVMSVSSDSPDLLNVLSNAPKSCSIPINNMYTSYLSP